MDTVSYSNHQSSFNSPEDLQLDYEYLNETTSGKREFQLELARIFLSEVGRELEAIALALSSRDFLAVSKAIHSLKSTVGHMGFEQNIGSRLTQFELACLKGEETPLLLSEFESISNNIDEAKLLVHNAFFQSPDFMEPASE